GEKAPATGLPGPRRSGIVETGDTARVSGDNRYFDGQGRTDACQFLQRDPRQSRGHPPPDHGQRDGVALPESGSLQSRKYWPLRAEPDEVCALYITDPAI